MNSESLSTDIRKSYTYLILFYDGSFYYGVRKCPKGKTPWNDDKYVGSPKTHKEKWNSIKYTKFILEIFNDYKDAQEVEKKLIRPNLNNPLCLNERVGGIVSTESCIKGGKIAGKKASESGQIKNLGKIQGIKNIESGHLSSISKKESLIKGGKIAGKISLESGHIHSIRTKESCIKGGKVSSSQKWRCLVTGHISAAGPLSNFQKSRGIDTSLRERIK